MGMSSYDCLVCGRALMSDYSIDPVPEWMKYVMVFMPDDTKIAGKYNGYLGVKTKKPIISEYSFHFHAEKASIDKEPWSPIFVIADQFYENSEGKISVGGIDSLREVLWYSAYACGPSCYHMSCWYAVGAPEGYRGPSKSSQDQGFGASAFVFPESEDPDYMDLHAPDTQRALSYEESQMLWAVNAITEFIYKINSFYNTTVKEDYLWEEIKNPLWS